MTAIDISEGVCQFLQTLSSVTAVIGTSPNDRIYPDVLPQGATLPAITYEEPSGQEDYHLTGRSGMAESRVQINCFAATRSAANALGRIVRNTLGDGVNRQCGGIYVRKCHVENDHTIYESPIDGSDAGRYVRSTDYVISYQQQLT